MQFHDYRTVKQQMLSDRHLYPEKIEWYDSLRHMKPANLRRTLVEMLGDHNLSEIAHSAAVAALAEDIWADNERPYYCVWPIATDLCKTVKLSVDLSQVMSPKMILLLRFARGHEPFDICVAMLSCRTDFVHIDAYPRGMASRIQICYPFEPGVSAEHWLEATRKSAADCVDVGELLIRLTLFIILLSHDRDFITPIVLSKDQQRYDSTDDPEVKKWLEDRAARRAGRGFDVGRRLQGEKDRSPHWRNPHLCLFWTGEGRQTPIIKMRSGGVVQRVSMAEVPTGYLGPETEEDDWIEEEKTPRESFSKSRRFEIMKRDGFTCQLCGRKQTDGVTLHIDHRMPLAKGGSNEDANLWTLCEDCNLGKSDKGM